jgi:hypothetical protein
MERNELLAQKHGEILSAKSKKPMEKSYLISTK